MENVIGVDTEARLLLDLWLHQNTLLWSRVRLIAGLQASALVANYVLKSLLASFGICIGAISATAFLLYVCEVDREIRDTYRVRLEALRFKVGLTPEERSSLSVSVAGVSFHSNITSHKTLMIILYGCMALDFIVLYVSILFFGWIGGRS